MMKEIIYFILFKNVSNELNKFCNHNKNHRNWIDVILKLFKKQQKQNNLFPFIYYKLQLNKQLLGVQGEGGDSEICKMLMMTVTLVWRLWKKTVV